MGLVFTMVLGPPKSLKNLSVPWGVASGTHVNFGTVLERGPGRQRSDDALGAVGIRATVVKASRSTGGIAKPYVTLLIKTRQLQLLLSLVAS